MSLYVNIKKSLGSFTLDAEFEAGNEILALFGSSGCGKSMTLKCIAGVEKPDEGVIIADGVTLFDSQKGISLPPQKRNIGLLFQNYALFPNMTVAENITSVLKLRQGINVKEELEAIMEYFYIKGLEEHHPSQLSGGQQQRAALARMLAGAPQAVMLDEPISALDSCLRWQLGEELLRHLRDFKGTAIYVSHDRDEVFRMCGRVCVMHRGKTEKLRSVSEFFRAPGTLASSRLSGCKNHSRAAKIADNRLYAKDWGCELICADKVQEETAFAGIRAHSLKPLCPNGENRLLCKVLSVKEDLFTAIVIVCPINAPDSVRGTIRIECAKEDAAEISPGEIITVSAAASDIMPLSAL